MANLTQMKMLEGLDGFLLIDKPENIPFSTVVKTVKRKFGLVKVGHGGSLDAQASGLFILLLNDANKFGDQVMGADREYTGVLDFTRLTNTGDAQGEAAGAGRGYSSADELQARFKELKGDLFQTEPRFAAIRREGTAEYTVVDTGEHSQFLGHVYRFAPAEAQPADSAAVAFGLKATKAVLPRALALELGATLVSLRRTAIGKLRVEDAVSFDRLLETELSDFAALVMPIGAALR